jgi:hypothetical protein
LKEMQKLWREEASTKGGAFWNKARTRSVFNDVYCKKVLAAAKEFDFKYNDEMAEMVEQDWNCVGGSQIDEDSFPELRAAETWHSGWSRAMQNKRKYYKLVTSGLESTVHRYDPIEYEDEPVPRGIAHLQPDNIYQPSLEGMPHFYLDIVGKTSATEWYSPQPLREAEQTIDFAYISQ